MKFSTAILLLAAAFVVSAQDQPQQQMPSGPHIHMLPPPTPEMIAAMNARMDGFAATLSPEQKALFDGIRPQPGFNPAERTPEQWAEMRARKQQFEATLSPEQKAAFEQRAGALGLPFRALGTVTANTDLTINGTNWGPLSQYDEAYNTALENIMEGDKMP